MTFNTKNISNDTLIDLYKKLILPRVIEDKMLLLLRQGKISKWFSGIGQEAISVGVTAALEADEFIFTLHRNLGVFTTREVPFARLFSQWQGKMQGFTKGRDRSFHFGTPEHHIIGMISHLGPQLSLADGVGLAHKLLGEKKIAVAFTGEGGTSQGEFHEALNVAAVWKLPVLFIIENNGYGLSTRTTEQYACRQLSDRGLGYGMKSVTIDGNNIVEVYQTVSQIAAAMRENPEPVLLECMTFRMRGHEEASGIKYVPKDLLEQWSLKDPILNYEKFLLENHILSEQDVQKIKSEAKTSIEQGVDAIYDEQEVVADSQKELKDVYAPFHYEQIQKDEITEPNSEIRMIDAIAQGMNQAMEKHPNLILMGQDIAEYGGVFKITEGLVEKFGKARVRNTPLCESAIIGTALGLSLKGFKSMVEMQFADFVTCGFNQIVNNLAKLHYRWGENADVVIRMPCGGNVAAGPFHSQTNEAWFIHTPGLKVVYPSNPYDAKGLLLTAFEDPNPIIFFEHKFLYRSKSGKVPEGYYTIPFGKARYAKKGSQLSIITYGIGVEWAEEAVEKLNISADIVDLRTLVPMDFDTIGQTVKNTGKVLILHEDSMFGGIGGEISAFIQENYFTLLDAPVVRVAGLDTPIPFTKPLETNYMAKSRLEAALKKLNNY
ncbi:MAG: dehydrogenase E1 component subunit alpha/beta [Saprospiraceae bacterium]|nr:dehydrogenase E1 component subunit alpha/beta [Saprospiraceae bacterium]